MKQKDKDQVIKTLSDICDYELKYGEVSESAYQAIQKAMSEIEEIEVDK